MSPKVMKANVEHAREVSKELFLSIGKNLVPGFDDIIPAQWWHDFNGFVQTEAWVDAALALAERRGLDVRIILVWGSSVAEAWAQQRGGKFLQWLPLAILQETLRALEKGKTNG